jgi:hypothetical protein
MIATYYKSDTTPTTTDDLAHGYLVGDTWLNTTSTTYDLYVCTINTNNAAVWVQQNNVVKAASAIITQEQSDEGVNSGYSKTNLWSDGVKIGSSLTTQEQSDEGVNSGYSKTNLWSDGIRIMSILLTVEFSAFAQIIRKI